MSKLITLIVILFTITTFSDQMPRQLVEASTKLVDIMQEPRTFLDVVEDMSFSNRVQFIRMVDSASNAFPSSREAKTNRNKELARYYFIATNTPYLNVPVIANSIQSGQILLSQLQFKQQGTNTLMQQRTDKTNVVYKANSNTMVL